MINDQVAKDYLNLCVERLVHGGNSFLCHVNTDHLQLSSGFVHLVITQVHHEDWKCILGFFPHVSVTILQAGVEMRNTQGKVRGNRAQAGQFLSQPPQQLDKNTNV